MYDSKAISAAICEKSKRQSEVRVAYRSPPQPPQPELIRERGRLKVELHVLQTAQAHRRGRIHAKKLPRGFWMLGASEPILEVSLEQQAKLLERHSRILEPYKKPT